MSAKHTPGPWRHLDQGQVVNDTNTMIAFATNHGGDEAGIANALLIAAAPDLLAACEIALANCSGRPPNEQELRAVVQATQTAIAKAKGEQT